MTAEEMFNELGYVKNIEYDFDNETIICIQYCNFHTSIEFWLDNRYFHIDGTSLTGEDLKAINKMCNELGWL